MNISEITYVQQSQRGHLYLPSTSLQTEQGLRVTGMLVVWALAKGVGDVGIA